MLVPRDGADGNDAQNQEAGNLQQLIEIQRAELEATRQALQAQRIALENARQQSQEEITRLRTELRAAESQANNIRADPNAINQLPVTVANAQQSNVSVSDIGTIVGAINHSNIEIKIPKFCDENQSNPLEFIANMEKFFRIKNIKEEKKMSMIKIAFEGKARSWLMLQGQVMTYSNFNKLFVKEFYSVPSQVKAKSIWSNKKYNDQYENLQNFYYKQLMDANYRHWHQLISKILILSHKLLPC